MARRGFRGSAGSPGPVVHRGRAGVNPVKGGMDTVPFKKAGALATGDFLHFAVLGSQAMDTNDGDLWVCTNAATATWSKVGTQT